ncbi:MAG: hypothetical protein ACHQRO_10355 [Vicinamibacteria bacterium]|jgi:hypothetical protein
MRSGRIAAIVAGLVITVVHAAAAQRDGDAPPPNAPSEKLVYADFEGAQGGKAVSSRGGTVSLTSYQESDIHKTTIKGVEGTNAPELVHVKPNDPNHLAKFEFAFMAPNSYAGAGVEIKGQADADGKTPPDDVSGFKKITFQLYAKGAETIRVEAISRGHGVDLQAGYPQMTFKVKPGLNTYEVALKALVPPGWVDVKIEPKKILQKLTALNISAYCEQQCRPIEGMLIVDNVTFEK